jgi:hypothetical protein
VDTFELTEARARSHVLRGILVGAGTVRAADALTVSGCGLGCGNAAITSAFLAAGVAGTLAGRRQAIGLHGTEADTNARQDGDCSRSLAFAHFSRRNR